MVATDPATLAEADIVDAYRAEEGRDANDALVDGARYSDGLGEPLNDDSGDNTLGAGRRRADTGVDTLDVFDVERDRPVAAMVQYRLASHGIRAYGGGPSDTKWGQLASWEKHELPA